MTGSPMIDPSASAAPARRGPSRLLARFRRGRKGVAAVEFALISPVLVLMFLGSVEVTHLLWAKGKVNDTVSTLADLISQEEELDDTRMGALLGAAPVLIEPYDSASLTLDVTSVVACYPGANEDAAPRYYASWSRGWANGALKQGGNAINARVREDALTDLTLRHGDSLILVEAGYVFQPHISYALGAELNVAEAAFYQPRSGRRIAYTGVESDPAKTCADYVPSG